MNGGAGKYLMLIILAMFFVHIFLHFFKKKICKQCSAKERKGDGLVQWVGVSKTQPSDEPLSSKFMSVFLQGKKMPNGGLFPIEQRLELCDECFAKRKKQIFNTMDPERAIHFRSLPQSSFSLSSDSYSNGMRSKTLDKQKEKEKEKEKKRQVPDFDNEYEWKKYEQGVRHRFREW